MTGIYCIENTANGKRYIGQARHIERRWRQHRVSLENGKHCNDHLQRAWKKYGENAFSFYVLELCDLESLSDRERFYGDANRGKYRTKEQREAMSKRVVCIETGTVYPSITSAAEAVGVTIHAISNALRGKCKTCRNLHWRYKEGGGES